MKGDVLISWRYEFLNGVPQGFKLRLQAACEAAALNYEYTYRWKEGILFTIKQVTFFTILELLNGVHAVNNRTGIYDVLEQNNIY